MNNEYIQYPDDAMVWVYQADRFFREEEKEFINQKISDFLSQWDSHGSLVKGTFTLKHDAFLVIFADGEGHALCGRAQTASVNMVKELEKDVGVKLMDRMCQSYRDGVAVWYCTTSDSGVDVLFIPTSTQHAAWRRLISLVLTNTPLQRGVFVIEC